VAETVFAQLLAFGGFSFAKSHAAAFAVIVYQSGWLKHFHFVPFYTALLNNQPMGFWTPAVLVNEAKRRGVTVLPVDLLHSEEKCTVEEGAIRLGFNYVKGLGEEQIGRLINARKDGSFETLLDFCRRVRLGRQVVENVILAGAMDSWGVPRRQLVWELGALHDQADELDLLFPSDDVQLPALTAAEALLVEQEVLGLSTGDHVMALYRSWMKRNHIMGSKGIESSEDKQRVRCAGLLVIHQAPPTAKGFHFLTLEDEDGMINVIVRPKVYDRYRRTVRTAQLLYVEGLLQKEGRSISVKADRLAGIEASVL